MVDPLAELNEQQREAVLATSGPVLILAGAGSGKTRALTHRIAYLIYKGLAAPHEIVAVTFTNKAAGEMKDRVRSLLGTGAHTPTAMSTFHSLGARLLREAANFTTRTRGFTILDTKDSERLVRHVLQEAGVSLRTFPPKMIRHKISGAKNKGILPADYLEQAHGKTDEIVASIWPRYEELLQANNAYDFDDLLVESVRLLDQHPAVQTTLKTRWRYIHVDEYQDTNSLQERLLHLLIGDEHNICVVGDDYQAIYSWRGANVDHILGFENRFPDCRVIRLTQNYRSTPEILSVAGDIISSNTRQKHKDLWTENPGGSDVEIIQLGSDREEASFIRRAIASHLESGGALSDCAILYRTNAQSRLFEEEFLTHQIPYTIIGGFRFYDRREIKDALALLQWYTNPNSRLALDRIAGALLSGVGPKTIDRWVHGAQTTGANLRQYLETQAALRPALAKFLAAYTRIPTSENVANLLQHLLKETGYLNSLKDAPDAEERLENIAELLNVTSVYTDVTTLLEEAALLTDLETTNTRDQVTCMTLHAAKGLEFSYVYIAGCEEDLLPHVSSITDASQIEEERRLLYVGVTRAKQKLTATFAQTRYQGGQLTPRMPSRFLEPIQTAKRQAHDAGESSLFGEEEISYAVQGEWVTHLQFGRGIVIGTSTSGVTCVFEGHGVKTVASNQLEVAA